MLFRSEATSNAVIINPDKQVKLSIRDKRFLARTVILDAGLLRDIPRSVLCYAAMDAYVQSYESYISRNADWFSEVLSLKGLELIDRHVEAAFAEKNEPDLSALLLGSYLTGIAFHISRLGLIHGIAHPLGVLYDQPHGLVCAVCFLSSLRLNRTAMGKKYDALSETVNQDFTARIESLLSRFSIESPFRGKGIPQKEEIIAAALASGSTAANPKPVERHDIESVLDELF